MENNYLFMLRRVCIDTLYGTNKLIIDGFHKLPSNDELEYEKLKESFKLTKSASQVVQSMKLRMRFNNDIIQNFFKVNTDCELTADDLQTHIDALSFSPNELTNFLADAKVRI
jgi:hypothetical protein